MIHLLLINLSEGDASSIINSLEANDIQADCLVLDNYKDLKKEVPDPASRDAIILSEPPSKNLPLLKAVSGDFSNTPIIFFTDDYSDQLYTEVMKHGAKDCISPSHTYQLPLILQRELSEQKVSDDTQPLTESPEVLAGILNLSTNDVFLFDTQHFTCCYANQTAITNLRYSHDEFKQMTASDIYSEYDSDSFSRLTQMIRQNSTNQIAICTNISRNMGSVYPAEVHFKIINHEGTPYLLAINKDISDTWYKVRKLKRQRSLADNYLTKHKQKEELLANAAHDMRTSLQSIILSNKLLFDKQSGDFQKGFNKFQKAIHFSGKHLLNYINEFFDPSLESGKSNSSDLNADYLDLEAFAQKMFLVFRPIAQRNEIDFHFESARLHHKHIFTNQTYVKRILKNFLSNAFKFTNEGSITFEIYSLPASELNNTSIDTNNAIAFNIQDTGIGIPEHQQESIFERHQRTENAQQGSGLGLHICKELAQAIGGTIKVESKVNCGSAFTLYLPATKSAPRSAISNSSHPLASPQESIPSQNKTILLVDDSEIHNLAIKEYLQYTFEKCIAVNSTAKAQQKLKEVEVDCIVSDFTLCDNENCINFLKRIRNDERYSEIPIIIYTGKKLSETEQHAASQYANAIVKKNTGSYDTLTNTIISLFRENSRPEYFHSK